VFHVEHKTPIPQHAIPDGLNNLDEWLHSSHFYDREDAAVTAFNSQEG